LLAVADPDEASTQCEKRPDHQRDARPPAEYTSSPTTFTARQKRRIVSPTRNETNKPGRTHACTLALRVPPHRWLACLHPHPPRRRDLSARSRPARPPPPPGPTPPPPPLHP